MPNQTSKGFVFYSNSTDVTGIALAEKLGADHGKTAPRGKYDWTLVWGANPKSEDFNETAFKANAGMCFNTVSAIKQNRNKLKALEVMRAAGVSVPKTFNSANIKAALAAGQIKFPIVGREKTHQGGNDFHLCLEQSALDNAIAAGCAVFTSYIPKKEEYRIHVFGDNALVSCIKKPQHNPEAGWIACKKELIAKRAQKNGVAVHNPTLDLVLKAVFDKEISSPNYIIRSNTRGWCFAQKDGCPNEVINQAKKAVKALGLYFGAVDAVVSDSGEVFVLEVNSGPGLEGTTLEAYVKEIKARVAAGVKKSGTVAAAGAAQTARADTSDSKTGKRTKLVAKLMTLPIAERNPLLEAIRDMNEAQLAGLDKLL